MANILIVDDAPDILQVLKFILKKQGHEVVTAENGQQALIKAREITSLTIACVDLNLPDTTGSLLANALKALIPGIKIVMLSGQEGIDSTTMGVDACLLKPFTSDQIKLTLEKLI